jgi:hypothetical protein
MGQEASSLVSEDTRPDTLSERSLAAVAELINGGRARRIVVMTGAGISTAAGSEFFFFPYLLSPSLSLSLSVSELMFSSRPGAVKCSRLTTKLTPSTRFPLSKDRTLPQSRAT